MRNSGRKAIELGALIVAYVLFAAIGVYSGQTTMNIEIINPPEGALFRSSPVELVARVTVKGLPVSDARARFTIRYGATGESNVHIVTDEDGFARLLVPGTSGDYTWHVEAMKEGYPTIVSCSPSFSIQLSLVVDGLLPSSRTLAVSPVDFAARVTDMNDHLVESANVTFYVDSRSIGSSLTDVRGVARLSAPVNSGSHSWYASATKNGEGGVSQLFLFIVGQPSLGTVDLYSFKSESHRVNLRQEDSDAQTHILRSPSHGGKISCGDASAATLIRP